MTGSQNFSILKSISESMAGRVAIFHLDPFSSLELVGNGQKTSWVGEYLKDPEHFVKTPKTHITSLPPLHEFLFRWTYPVASRLPLKELEIFFFSYIQTYVERDVRLVENIEQLTLFGLACHLMRIHSPEALISSMKLGPLFETWAVNFLQQHAEFANCYHWRSHGGGEVDLLLEQNGMLYPIEIKAKSHPNKSDLAGLQAVRATYPKARIAPSLVIHAGEETYPIDSQTLALSWKAL